MKKPKPVKRTKVNEVFAYTSACHNVRAEKPALTMPDGVGIGSNIGHAPKTENGTGLGGWRCTACRKPCKVSRSRVKTSEVTIGA